MILRHVEIDNFPDNLGVFIVYVKEEPVETNTDVKPVFQQHEVDMKPACIKREIITPVSPTTELENPETTMSSVSVFSRQGPKQQQCDYTPSSTDKRRREVR
jgi:hypothetical protein